jgi:hypothetical protein
MTTIDDRGVALYHVVLPHEGFEESARALFRLVHRAQETKPGQRRMLFLDIEGHRQADGRFDADMYELQHDFLLGVLAPFLTEAPIRRVELHRRYGGGGQSGISPSKSTPNVFTFSDPARGERHGYIDARREDGLFHWAARSQTTGPGPSPEL